MKIVKVEEISTGKRLRDLIFEKHSTQKEFIQQFGIWMDKHEKYKTEAKPYEKDLSRWMRDVDPVKMRSDKIEMFADYFHVDVEYLNCEQAEKRKIDSPQIDIESMNLEKVDAWINLLLHIGYSIKPEQMDYNEYDVSRIIKDNHLISIVETHSTTLEIRITDLHGNDHLIDSQHFFRDIENYIEFLISKA